MKANPDKNPPDGGRWKWDPVLEDYVPNVDPSPSSDAAANQAPTPAEAAPD